AGQAPLSHLAWAVGLNGVLVLGAVGWFYRTMAYCRDQGLLVRVGE
ncbi:MAG TPA: ABC transporter, partial [Nitrospira sp.]|nr:ABC transporter [Nitrospira sp.]